MPIPLGILAAAGVRPAVAAGAYELIETVTVGSGGAASVTFSNLNTYSTTYQHLQIRGVSQSTSGSDLYMQFNNVTAAGSYSTHYLYGFGGSVSSTTVSNDKLYVGVSGNTGTDGPFGSTVIDILDAYETTKNKTIRVLAGRSGSTNSIIMLASGARLSTDAISSIRLFQSAGNLAQYSRFSIYGLKASA